MWCFRLSKLKRRAKIKQAGLIAALSNVFASYLGKAH